MDDIELHAAAEQAWRTFREEARLPEMQMEGTPYEEALRLLLWKVAEIQKRHGLEPDLTRVPLDADALRYGASPTRLLERLEDLEKTTPKPIQPHEEPHAYGNASALVNQVLNALPWSHQNMLGPGTVMRGVVTSIVQALSFDYDEKLRVLKGSSMLQVVDDKLREVGLSFDTLKDIEMAKLQTQLAQYRAKFGALPEPAKIVHQHSRPTSDLALCGAAFEAVEGGIVNCDVCISILNTRAEEAVAVVEETDGTGRDS